MVHLVRVVGLGLGAALIAAQAIQVERQNPPVTGEVPATPAAAAVLRRACYDCHSFETTWPWYSRVAPVSWLVAHDVDEGRDELNFSTWSRLPAARRAKKLREIVEEVEEGEMPPLLYRLVHPEARLTPEDVAALRTWATGDRGG